MANIGDAYNMEGMKAKYADFMVYAVKALSYGYLGRIISLAGIHLRTSSHRQIIRPL